MLEKVISNRMLISLNSIISEDQRGFLPNRRISVNIRKMLDIINYCNNEEIEAFIFSCDFEKCFDKVSHPALIRALQYFDFGERVIKWTEIMYSKFEVIIQNNGNFSDPVKVMQGVYQGGPASSTYFLVIAEILALNKKKNNPILKGSQWQIF